MTAESPRSIVITGASSGIGKALALATARPGVHLGLLGRNGSRLAHVAAACREAGAVVEIGILDVRARIDMAGWLTAFDDASPVDLVIANAGIMEGTPPDGEIEPADASYDLMHTNVLGALNTVQPLLLRMMARRSGQIAFMSSLSGLIPLRDSPSYCGSKAAVLAYGLSLRDLLRTQGIRISVICPGYVTTPMSRRETGDKPFEMAPEDAAAAILRGLRRDKSVIAFPFWYAVATRLGALLPDWLRERVTRDARFRVLPSDL